VQAGQRDRAGAGAAEDLHVAADGRHRDRHVGRVGGDARLRVAEDREVAVIALARRAARSRLPLVAGLGDVLEVGAAGALQQVAGHRGHVAQLARGAGQQRLGEHRVALADGGMDGQVGVAHRAADAQAAVRQVLDAIVEHARDVDQASRRMDAELHEVDEVGAAGEVHRVVVERGDGGGGVGRALVGERPQRATSAIAGTMFA
jgi:hypothetical protein